MADQSGLSREQRDIQARIAQRRIDKIRKILASGVQSSTSEAVDSETSVVISRLYDTSLSDADLSSCIAILEMLLLLEALQPLLNVIKSETYSMPLRKQAAEAIAKIGSSHIANELIELRSSPSAELRHFAEIALK